MKRFLFIFCLLLLLLANNIAQQSYAQSTFKFYDDISLPQTDAWNFVRQGEVSPSMYTGTINLSVPIYEYKDKDFTIPIVATYSSNGNTPNQIAGILGPGWNLELGGCITIETNGIPDYGENLKHVQGFYTVHRNNTFTTNQPEKWWRFMYNLLQPGSGTGSPEILWVNGAKPTHEHTGEVDAQPDIFHFSVPGHSGKFHLGFHGDVIFFDTPLSPMGYKLQIDTVQLTADAYHFSKFHTITLTTPDGYRYIFDGDPAHDNVDIAKSGERSVYDIVSAWHLTRMEAPDGRWAAFQYSSLTHTTYTPGSAKVEGGVSDTQYYSSPPVIPAYSPVGLEDAGRIQERETRTARLDQITFSDGSTITLTYSVLNSASGDQYKENPAAPEVKGYANTVRLSAICVTRAGNPSSVAQASFTHARNTNGGKTNYLQSITVNGIGTYSFNYIGWNNASRPYPLQNTFSVDHWGYYNGKANTSFFPSSSVNTGTQKETIDGTSRNPDSQYAILGMIEKITYPTGGYTTFEYEPHTYSAAIVRNYDTSYVRNFVPRPVAAEGTAGGLRIKKISSFLANGSPSMEKTYCYEDALGRSSGILAWTPRYSVRFECQANNNLKESSYYKSSSLQDYGFADIEYRCVTERLKDSTRTLNIFTSSADGKGFLDARGTGFGIEAVEKALDNHGNIVPWVMDKPAGQTVHSVHFAVSPVTSFQSQRGMLKERRVFKNDTTLSASVIETTSFKLDTTSFTELPCYLVRLFSTYRIFTGKHLPKETVTSTRDDSMETEKRTARTFKYNPFREVTRSAQTTLEGDTLIYEYIHLRDLEDSQIENNIVYRMMKRKNILSLPLDEKIFRKQAGQTQKTLISGKRCTYSLFPSEPDTLILPTLIEAYDLNTQTWKKEAEILSYDSFGNITQLRDADGRTVSYLWSNDGQYLMLQAKGLTLVQVQQHITNSGNISASAGIPDSQETNLRNAFKDAEITTIKYICGVGPQRIRDAAGNTTEYTYTRWGKLKQTRRYKTATSSENIDRNTYSNDN
ncbi:MAG: hypothetical protein J6T04_03790 [Bacteroidales bacterium]|nr:hypothetical protein [Bacteroidales bacterium]